MTLTLTTSSRGKTDQNGKSCTMILYGRITKIIWLKWRAPLQIPSFIKEKKVGGGVLLYSVIHQRPEKLGLTLFPRLNNISLSCQYLPVHEGICVRNHLIHFKSCWSFSSPSAHDIHQSSNFWRKAHVNYNMIWKHMRIDLFLPKLDSYPSIFVRTH